ncbi:centlein-like [Glandiceps talaboti]
MKYKNAYSTRSINKKEKSHLVKKDELMRFHLAECPKGQYYYAEISQLRAENQALADELSQCQADKEFVWSLWKRLQVASPDMTQAISLVVAREKEKAELKDKKVLDILQIKDNRISELEKLLSQQQKELNDFVARKLSLDEEKDILEKENRELRNKTKSLEDLLESRQSRLKTNEELNRQVIDKLERDKQDLTKRVTEHLIQADKSQEELVKLKAINERLDNRVQNLSEDLLEATQRYERLSRELEETAGQLDKQELRSQKHECVLETKDREVDRLRKDLSELRSVHGQCSEHATQQADLIKQLQSLQFDTQKILKSQEDAHTMEASSLQSMYSDLNSRYKAVKYELNKAERQLSNIPTRNAGMQVNLAPWDAEAQTCESCVINECKMSSLQTEIDLLKERLKEKSRLIYEMDKEAPTQDHDLSMTRSKRTMTELTGSVQSGHISSLRSRSLSPVRSPLRTSSPKLRARKSAGVSTDRKLENLEKLLRVKHNENEEIRAAHNRRLERLRALQQNYNILKEQIKTYEEAQSGRKKRKKVHRSDPRKLQQEDSDSVWNELTYFKGQNRNLLMDRMNLQEELDLLKVQTATDTAHIEDLTRCLQDEKEQLRLQLTQAEKSRKIKESERKDITELKKQIKSCENLIESLEKEAETLTDERDKLVKDKRALKIELSKIKPEAAEQETEIQQLTKENHYLKKKLKQKKSSRSRRKQKTLKDHQRALNRSIEHMSAVFSDFPDDGWEEISTDSGEETGESLGYRIVESARKYGSEKSSSDRKKKKRSSRDRLQDDSSTQKKSSDRHRQVTSIQSHIKRLARAYDEEPKRKVGWSTIAVQTDDETPRSCRRMIDMGVGDHSVDEMLNSVAESTLERTPVKRRDIATSPHMGLHKLGRSVGKTSSRPESPNISSLKQRLGSLQQQVTVLRDSKASIQRTLNDEREAKEQLQSDFNVCNQRLKINKQTVQKLTQELENCQTQKESLERQLATKLELSQSTEIMYGKLPTSSGSSKHTDTEYKQLESKLKNSQSEVSKQAGVIKTLKSENESQTEQLKTLQEKINRLERDVSQKRSLIEDLRGKVKSTQEEKKNNAESIKALEDKIKSLTDGSDQKKSYTESLKKRVTALTKEKHHYEDLYFTTNTELEKKTKQLIDAQNRRTEAENTAAELETAAAQQLHGLASKSESALDSIKSKLKKAHGRIQELNQFVKVLAAELLNQVHDARELVRQAKKSKVQNGMRKGESRNKLVHSLASSILDMSEADIEDFMNSTDGTLQEEMTTEALDEHQKDVEWNRRWQAVVNSKVPFAKDLMEILMEKVTERDQLLSKVETTPTPKSTKHYQL